YPEKGILFHTSGTGLDLRPNRKKDGYGTIVVSKRAPLEPIPPGGEWSTTIYLQRFINQPPPGRYCLPYELALSYDKGTPQGLQTAGTIRCQGQLVFTVDEGSPHELIEVLKTYEANLHQSDLWRQIEVREALFVAETPEVVPFLIRLLPERRQQAVASLGRFPNHPAARQAVLDSLRTMDISATSETLHVLWEWHHQLDPADVQMLLDSDSMTIRDSGLLPKNWSRSYESL